MVSEIKEPWIEIPFICLENHWFTHEVFTGMVSTTRQWRRGTGIFRLEAWCANPTDIAIIMGQFFLLWSTFLITEHKIAKKSSKLSNMTSIEYSTQCHLMFQQRLFLILIFWKQGLLMCFMTRCLFFFFQTLCVRLDWQMLEGFASIDSSGDCGLSTLNTQIPARGERNQTRLKEGW